MYLKNIKKIFFCKIIKTPKINYDKLFGKTEKINLEDIDKHENLKSGYFEIKKQDYENFKKNDKKFKLFSSHNKILNSKQLSFKIKNIKSIENLLKFFNNYKFYLTLIHKIKIISKINKLKKTEKKIVNDIRIQSLKSKTKVKLPKFDDRDLKLSNLISHLEKDFYNDIDIEFKVKIIYFINKLSSYRMNGYTEKFLLSLIESNDLKLVNNKELAQLLYILSKSKIKNNKILISLTLELENRFEFILENKLRILSVNNKKKEEKLKNDNVENVEENDKNEEEEEEENIENNENEDDEEIDIEKYYENERDENYISKSIDNFEELSLTIILYSLYKMNCEDKKMTKLIYNEFLYQEKLDLGFLSIWFLLSSLTFNKYKFSDRLIVKIEENIENNLKNSIEPNNLKNIIVAFKKLKYNSKILSSLIEKYFNEFKSYKKREVIEIIWAFSYFKLNIKPKIIKKIETFLIKNIININKIDCVQFLYSWYIYLKNKDKDIIIPKFNYSTIIPIFIKRLSIFKIFLEKEKSMLTEIYDSQIPEFKKLKFILNNN